MADPAVRHSAVIDDFVVTPTSGTYTRDAASNYVFISVAWNDNTDDISGVTYGGVSMTQIGKQTNNSRFNYLYGLANPASGSQTVAVTAAGGHSAFVIGMDLSDVDTVDIPGIGKKVNGTTLTSDITTTGTHALLILSVLDFDGGDPNVAGTGATKIVEETTFKLLALFTSDVIYNAIGTYHIQTTKASSNDLGHIVTAVYPTQGTNQNITSVGGVGAVASVSIQSDYAKSISAVGGVGAVADVQIIVGPVVTIGAVGGVGAVAPVTITIDSNKTLTVVGGVGAVASVGVSSGFTISNQASGLKPYAFNASDGTGYYYNVPVAGTYGGTYTPTSGSVQVQVEGSNSEGVLAVWASLTGFSAAGGNWSGNLKVYIPIIYGGLAPRYKLRARDTILGIQTALQTQAFSVGLIEQEIGSSMSAIMYDASNLNAGRTFTRHARNVGGGWVDAGLDVQSGETGVDTEGAIGICTQFDVADMYLTANLPYDISTAWVGGSNLQAWQVGTGWAPAALPATLTTRGIPDFQICTWQNGIINYQDVDPSGVPTLLANLYTLATGYNGRNTSNFVHMTEIPGNFLAGIDASADVVRASIWNILQTSGWAYGGNGLGGKLDGGEIHYDGTSALGTEYIGRLRGYCLAWALNRLFGSSVSTATVSPFGLQIARVIWPVGSANATVEFTQLSGGTAVLRGDGSNSGAVLGFSVNAGSGGQTLSTQTLGTNGKVTLGMSGVRVLGQTPTLKYCSGSYPQPTANSKLYDNRKDLIGDLSKGFPLLPTSILGATASIPMSATRGGAAVLTRRRRR